MAVLGLDLGSVRIGVAIAHDGLGVATPRPAVDGRDHKTALDALCELIREDDVTHLVVGLPLRTQGDEGPEAKRCRLFAEELSKRTRLPVTFWDERMSTSQAQRVHRAIGKGSREGRKHVDSDAACVILQSWLNQGQFHAS